MSIGECFAPYPLSGRGCPKFFFKGGVSPAKLALAALAPTVIVGAAYMLL